MSSTHSQSLSSHSSNFLRNPHRLRLPEIVFWSLIEWFYWMAFMVLIVWAVAQMQVESTLRKEPNLVGRLHDYAQVGRDWETLSVAADIAGPVLQVVTDLRSAPYWSEIDVLILRMGLPTNITIRSVEEALKIIVYAGNEFREISKLDRVAHDIALYQTDHRIESLRLMKDSHAAGAKTMQQAHGDFDKIVSAVKPLVDVGSSAFGAIASGLRFGSPIAVGYSDQVIQAADYLEQLPQPATDLMKEAQGFSKRMVTDAGLLHSMHQAIVAADTRETIFTYFVFRDFIQWFLAHIWWINGVVFIAIAIRLLLAYFRLNVPAAVPPRPRYAAPPTI
ncbi:hypothetical protein [Caldilinea sp.]|uniref:hypothetical protein n=1 Tax=Caldilinea sp. TaxID=2293560 RepID=UPI002D141B68|nr:hypothetical protein [Caldilinea sp.]